MVVHKYIDSSIGETVWCTCAILTENKKNKTLYDTKKNNHTHTQKHWISIKLKEKTTTTTTCKYKHRIQQSGSIIKPEEMDNTKIIKKHDVVQLAKWSAMETSGQIGKC